MDKIGICNLALGHLGMPEITSLSEDSPSADACNNYFDLSRDDTLSDYNWPFAKTSEALVATSDTVLQLEWGYVYVYPTTAAAVWAIYDEGTPDKKYEQEFETAYKVSTNQKVLCSNLNPAYVEYTRKILDTNIFSSRFCMLMSYRLAAAMAHILTGDRDMGLKLLDIYGTYLSEAKRLGYSERRKKPKQTSSYVASRG